MSDFGTTLREARERRGITLRQIADRTKISIASLEALERSDASRLPGGIFARSFVRSYAAEVGLDPDATVEAFLDRFGDDPRFAVLSGTAPADQAPAPALRLHSGQALRLRSGQALRLRSGRALRLRSGQALRLRSGPAPRLPGTVLKLLVLGLVALGLILYFTVIRNASDQSTDPRPDSARRATRRVATVQGPWSE